MRWSYATCRNGQPGKERQPDPCHVCQICFKCSQYISQQRVTSEVMGIIYPDGRDSFGAAPDLERLFCRISKVRHRKNITEMPSKLSVGQEARCQQNSTVQGDQRDRNKVILPNLSTLPIFIQLLYKWPARDIILKVEFFADGT